MDLALPQVDGPDLHRHGLAGRGIGRDIGGILHRSGETAGDVAGLPSAFLRLLVEKDHLPVRIDDGLDPTEISREWLEQVINSGIQRRIDGIRIACIELPQTHPGKVAYVVHVPQSTRAPHQASDHRFYKRFNFQSVAMEEYEVRDIARRGDAPDLRLTLSIVGGSAAQLAFKDGDLQSAPFGLEAHISNSAPVPASHSVLLLLLDVRLQVTDAPGWKANTTKLSAAGADGIIFPLAAFERTLAVPRDLPVFQGPKFKVTDKPVLLTVPREAGIYWVGWVILAAGTSARPEVLGLLSDGETVRLLGQKEPATL